jgi:signal peptidase II
MILKALSVSSIVLIVDRLTKYFLFRNLAEGESIKVVPGLFHITLVLNTGAAFGLFKGRSIFFTVSTIVVISLICLYMQGHSDFDRSGPDTGRRRRQSDR